MPEVADELVDAKAVLPLEQSQILGWADAFGDTGKALWADCARLADRFWGMPEGQERLVTWHHLLMAVGNFKRQTPIHIGAGLTEFADELPARPRDVVVPGGPRRARDDVTTWRALTDLPGLGVATATTLLSALWPGEHVIIDRLAWRAAVGLRASEGLSSRGVAPESGKHLPEVTWGDYVEYLSWVRATARVEGVKPQEVERTLYQLPRKIPESKSRSWKQYGDLLRAECEGTRPREQ
ncbi:MAG: hypothetical protein QOI10_3789 [Solirubrobacterales bacterium]|nr:hypothetical protein [Solirubrobacterales bacterium]